MYLYQDKHKRVKKDKKKRVKERKHSSKKDRDDSGSSSSSSGSDSESSSSSDDSNVRRSIITGKKIKMHRESTAEDKLLEMERAAKRHFMNSQY